MNDAPITGLAHESPTTTRKTIGHVEARNFL